MKLKNQPLLNRVVLIFLVIFSIKFFCNCGFTNPPLISIKYNQVKIIGIDNSGRFMKSDSINTMHYQAVAMNMKLYDTTMVRYSYVVSDRIQTLSFSKANALSRNENYITEHKVTDIKITTLVNIDSNIKAGENIDNYILYSLDNNFELYKTKKDAITKLNSVHSMHNENEVQIILKTPVQNNKAQFKVEVFLENDAILTDTTNVFQIIK